MLLGLQIAGVLFALFMLYMVFVHKKRNEFTLKEYGFWTFFWILFIYFVLMPHSFDFIIKDVLNFSRTFDFFVVVGFMFTIGAVFYSYTVIRKTQRKVDLIVRNVAIKNAEKKNKK